MNKETTQPPSCMHCGRVFAAGDEMIMRSFVVGTENSGVTVEIIAPYCSEDHANHNAEVMVSLAISLLAADTLRGAVVNEY